jgi:hypothetical protein
MAVAVSDHGHGFSYSSSPVIDAGDAVILKMSAPTHFNVVLATWQTFGEHHGVIAAPASKLILRKLF